MRIAVCGESGVTIHLQPIIYRDYTPCETKKVTHTACKYWGYFYVCHVNSYPSICKYLT